MMIWWWFGGGVDEVREDGWMEVEVRAQSSEGREDWIVMPTHRLWGQPIRHPRRVRFHRERLDWTGLID